MAWPKTAYSSARSTQRLMAMLPWVITAALVALMAYRVVLVAGLLPEHAGQGPAAAGTASSRGAALSADARALNLNTLPGLHLFGRSTATEQTAAVPVSAPDTQLNLTLHGVLVDAAPADRGAIIGKSGGEQRFFRVGASVFGSAKLAEVRTDHVILSRQGKYEALRFPSTPNLIDPHSRPLPRAAGVPVRSAAAPRSQGQGGAFAAYRHMAATNPQQLNQYLAVIPANTRDGFQGFRVLPGRDHALYQKLGLSPVDVLVSVNGEKLTSNMNAGSVLQRLLSTERPSVQLIRGGTPLTLVLQLK